MLMVIMSQKFWDLQRNWLYLGFDFRTFKKLNIIGGFCLSKYIHFKFGYSWSRSGAIFCGAISFGVATGLGFGMDFVCFMPVAIRVTTTSSELDSLLTVPQNMFTPSPACSRIYETALFRATISILPAVFKRIFEAPAIFVVNAIIKVDQFHPFRQRKSLPPCVKSFMIFYV